MICYVINHCSEVRCWEIYYLIYLCFVISVNDMGPFVLAIIILISNAALMVIFCIKVRLSFLPAMSIFTFVLVIWFLIQGRTTLMSLSSAICCQVRLKPALRATEASQGLDILCKVSTDIILYKERKTKMLIGLRECAGWSASLLFETS